MHLRGQLSDLNQQGIDPLILRRFPFPGSRQLTAYSAQFSKKVLGGPVGIPHTDTLAITPSGQLQ